MAKRAILSILLIGLIGVFFVNNSVYINNKNTVNVYCFYGTIPPFVFKAFEKETGIKVICDFYDNNDTLEAKLLTNNSGYDVVFPSLIPYATRQSYLKIYKKLEPDKIPNLKWLNPVIVEKAKNNGGDLNYMIPYYWGTIGIAIDRTVIYRLFPDTEIDSYEILLNPKKLKILSEYGVSFPDEFIDIYPQTMVYLGRNPTIKSVENLQAFRSCFKRLRPHIGKFSSGGIVPDLLAGNICAGISCSDNVYRATQTSSTCKRKVKFINPRKGGLLWVDCVCIPEAAPHPDNALKFVNFLLRPEISQKISDFSGLQVTNQQSIEYARKSTPPEFCPNDEEIKQFYMGNPTRCKSDLLFDKVATGVWTQIRLNNFDGELNETYLKD